MGLIPERAVYFDATFLRFAHDLRGVPQVMVQLIRFLEAAEDRPALRYLITQEAAEKFLRPLGVPDARICRVKPLPVIGMFERFHGLGTSWQYRRLRGVALGIMHPEPRTVVAFNMPQWVLLYDLIILERGLSGEKSPMSRRFLYQRKLRRLAHVTTSAAISSYTVERVRHHFPELPKGQPTPLLLGIRKSLSAAALESRPTVPTLAERSDEKGAPLRLLYVGSYDARKNIPALLQAMPDLVQSMAQGLKASGGGPLHVELHLAGHITLERRELIQRMADDWPDSLTTSTLSLTVHGLVSEQALVALYAQSHFFVFPSVFEGFGLPVMEAMAFGMPVFAFRNSSLPEIAGDAACLTETGDFIGWGKRLAEVLQTPGLYQEWVAKVRHRAMSFTEEAMRERYLKHWRGFWAQMSGSQLGRAKGNE